jgi:hypothetical protein
MQICNIRIGWETGPRARLPDVVGVETGVIVSVGGVYNVAGGLGGVALGELSGGAGTVLESGQTLRLACVQVCRVGGLVDEGVIAVVAAEIDILFLLDTGIVPSI